MKSYRPVIGLEIHVELKTQSKMFCDCESDYFGKEPNIHACQVCLGLPGALPVPNQKAIEWTVLIGKALNCKINPTSKFDRKHYFYPDLPKGYQISQYDEPIAINGSLKLKIKNEKLKIEEKTFRLTRVHLEEDTAKLIHLGGETLIDFNRSGVPLVEIVTEPEFDNVDDVKRFLEELQVIIRYLGVSEADMEKGSMRLEPNISVREIPNPKSQIPNKSQIQNANDEQRFWTSQNDDLPNYKVEVKNINSFRFVKLAIEHEIDRQTELLEKGETPLQETRGFDEKNGETYAQRTKEEAHDYRYFPEPDIPPLIFSKKYVEDIKVPELPEQKVGRYMKGFKINYQSAFILTRDQRTASFFEAVISNIKNQIANPPNGRAKQQIKNTKFEQIIANFIINKKISAKLSLDEFVKKAVELLSPKQTDEKALAALIKRLIETQQKAVEDYKKGKENAIMFLVGEVMREMKGKADAKIVKERILSKINNE